MSAFLTTPGTADVTRQLHAPARPRTTARQPHATGRQVPLLHLFAPEACTGENLEGNHIFTIFHPRTVLLCGVCACTLCDLLRCVAGDERCRRNSARLTSLDDLGYRAGPPLTISGCGARRQPPPTHSADIAKGRTPGVDLTPTTSYQVQSTDLSCSSVDCVAVRRRTRPQLQTVPARPECGA